MAQRLVRKLCNACKRAYKPSKDLLERIGLTPAQAKDITFYEAVGCDECGETGYKGRLPIFEVMEMSDEIARLTMERANASIIRKAAVRDGMKLLIQDGLDKIKEGLTTIDEVLSVASIEHDVVE